MPVIEKDLTISLLFDFYGEILTDIQKRSIDYYYNHDLSLAEIAQHSGITRQGVRDSIKRAEKQLLDFEDKLHLYQRFHRLQEGLEDIKACADVILLENQRHGNSPVVESEATNIIDIAKHLNE